MKTPDGDPLYGKSLWKLNKALYCLKQASKEWNDKLNSKLIKIGFKRLKSEPYVYVKQLKETKLYIYIIRLRR